MPYEASVDSDLHSGDLSQIYSTNIVDPMGQKEVDEVIRNTNGEGVGHVMRNKFPDANADYSSKSVAPSRLIRASGYNPYEVRQRREQLAEMPEKVEDEASVQRKLNHRNSSNAIRHNLLMNKNGIGVEEQIMDSGRPTYNAGGHDRRDFKDRVYGAPITRRAGIDKPRQVQPSTHVNPVSQRSNLGALSVSARTEPIRSKGVLASAKDVEERNKFTSIRVPDIQSKRAQRTQKNHSVGFDVTAEGHKINKYENELVATRQYDVNYLPSVRNTDENPVSGTFDVRNSQHDRVDNLPPEYDFANIDRRNARESQAPGRMNYSSGESRPSTNRADFEYNPTTFIKRSELEKANPVGINDQKTQKKTPGGARSYTFEAIVHDRTPGTIVKGGTDDGLHTVMNGPANVDERSTHVLDRFNYDVNQSVKGRRMIVPPMSIGKQETWRRNQYDPNASINRPAPASYENMRIGPD